LAGLQFGDGALALFGLQGLLTRQRAGRFLLRCEFTLLFERGRLLAGQLLAFDSLPLRLGSKILQGRTLLFFGAQLRENRFRFFGAEFAFSWWRRQPVLLRQRRRFARGGAARFGELLVEKTFGSDAPGFCSGAGARVHLGCERFPRRGQSFGGEAVLLRLRCLGLCGGAPCRFHTVSQCLRGSILFGGAGELAHAGCLLLRQPPRLRGLILLRRQLRIGDVARVGETLIGKAVLLRPGGQFSIFLLRGQQPFAGALLLETLRLPCLLLCALCFQPLLCGLLLGKQLRNWRSLCGRGTICTGRCAGLRTCRDACRDLLAQRRQFHIG
jgi:hypothetical protein